MDDDRVKVCVQRMSGEELEVQARLNDTISELKLRLSEQWKVPRMCQKLILQEPVTEDFRGKAEIFFKTKAAELVERLDRRLLYELKALNSPPRAMYEGMAVVHILICSCPSIRSVPPTGLRKRSLMEPGWHMLRALMSADTHAFLRGLQEFPDEAVGGQVNPKQIHAAQTVIEGMEGSFTPEHLGRFSLASQILCEWSLVSLELYKALHDGGWAASQNPQDTYPLSLYSDGTEPLKLSFLTDLEPAFRCLSADYGHQLAAMQALAVLGDKCLDRSIPAVAMKLRDQSAGVRRAASDSLKQLCHGNPEAAGILREKLGPCTQHSPWYAATEIMDVLAHVAGDADGHLYMLSWLIGSMCFAQGTGPTDAWAHFQEKEHQANASQVAGLLIASMQQEELPVSAQEMIRDALAKVGARDGAAVTDLLLPEVQLTKAPFQRARAAAVLSRVATREDEAIVKALLDDVTSSEGSHLLQISSCLSSLSPSSRPQILDQLRGELKRKGCTDCQDVIKQMAACAAKDDEKFIATILRYLKQADHFKSHEWPASVMTAVDVVGPAASADISGAQEAIGLAAKALCKKMVSGDERCRPPLLEIVARYELPADLQKDLIRGLRRGGPVTQVSCQTILKRFLKGRDLGPLLDVIENDIHTKTQCLGIGVLASVAARGQPDVVALLGKLATNEDVVLKSSAIAALGQCATFDAKICGEFRAHLKHDDAYVRLASLQSLKSLEEDPGALLDDSLRCLDDPMSMVVHAAVTCLEGLLKGREEVICGSVSRLINHRDEEVRQAVVSLLGKMTAEGKPDALSALTAQAGQVWPETSLQVRKAWEEAMQALTA